ncbi:MAG: hypothetical protein ACI9WS_002128 [Paraglaciecola psychrophila]|jgi:hypothetical protein
MIKVTALVLSTILFTGMAQACTKPEAPILPDAATAVTAQMMKAKNDVNDYLKGANLYLECVRNDLKANRMVKSMKQVGEDFNLTVRSYKERMSNG